MEYEDSIVIESEQHKIGWMADFPPLLKFVYSENTVTNFLVMLGVR